MVTETETTIAAQHSIQVAKNRAGSLEKAKDHTHINRLCETKLGEITDFFNNNGVNLRIVGSVGTSLSLYSQVPNMENNRQSRKPYRDIDILTIGQREDKNRIDSLFKHASEIAHPFPIDNSMFIESSSEGTFIRYRKLKYKISEEIFKKREIILRDKQVPTLDLNTIFHLPALYMRIRPKDFKNALELGRILRFEPLKRDMLPEELFKPFHELMKKKRDLYPIDILVSQVKCAYIEHFPVFLKPLFSPPLDKLKKMYIARL